MYFLIAAPEQDTLALVYATKTPQFNSETVTAFRLVKSNRALWNRFSGLLERYHAQLKDHQGVTLERDGSVTFFRHTFE